MDYLQLPRTDLRVSTLCLGTADFGADVPRDASLTMLDRFVEAGGNFLDTAAVYADWTSAGKGSSERLIGEWLATRRPPNLVLATKGAHPELHAMGVSRFGRADIAHDIETSLKNLGVDTLDLWYLHRDDPGTPVEEVLTILEEHRRAGHIRYYACSNWHVNRISEAQRAAEKMGVTGFVANQPLWSLAIADLTGSDPTLAAMNDEMHEFHTRTQLAAIPYSSQANGFFQKVAAGTPVRAILAAYESDLVREENHARFRRLERLAQETGLSLSQLVLGFLRSQPFPVVPIIGPKRVAQLEDSLAGADVWLSPEQIAVLEGRTA